MILCVRNGWTLSFYEGLSLCRHERIHTVFMLTTDCKLLQMLKRLFKSNRSTLIELNAINF